MKLSNLFRRLGFSDNSSPGVRVRGRCLIRNVYTGRVLVDKKNLVVNTGLNHIRDRISGLATVPDAMGYTAVGSGSTAADPTDTSLESIIGSGETAVVSEPANYQVKYSTTYASGVGTGDWTECGVFNAAAAGTMLCRVVFSSLSKGADDSFSVEYTITFSDDGV